MKLLFYQLVLFFLLPLYFQNELVGQEVYDLKTAKAIALADHKLIIVDFWDYRCKPCKKMDKELWGSKAFRKLYDRFVLLKIDIDSDIQFSRKYGIKSIPNVMVLSANEDLLYSQSGSYGSNYYLKIFKQFPVETKRLNTVISGVLQKKDLSPQEAFALGYEYGRVGRALHDNKVRRRFLVASNKYLKQCKLSSNSEEMKLMSNMNYLLNEAYLGNYKKVLKRISKLKGKHENLYYFILAYCHQHKGNYKEFRTYKGKIKSNYWLRQLLGEGEKV